MLWHIPVSHYSEKVRWALDHKGIHHERRAPPPPSHMAVALWLTRGGATTFPVLALDGRAIGDSTAIIAALERRYPEPPLYPPRPEERKRALELEEYFDEELGPYSRLLAFHELRRDPEGIAEFAAGLMPDQLARRARLRRLAGRGASAYVDARFRVSSDEAADQARVKIVAAFDRLESELGHGAGEYLVGDAFSVADLTAASLLFPVALPPEGPDVPELPAAYERFTGSLRNRPGYRWVTDMAARHRRDARRP